MPDNPIQNSFDVSLFKAASEGRDLEVEHYIKLGANPNAAGGFGKATPLIEAATRGHLHALRALLAHGADPSRIDGRGINALISACNFRHTPCVKALLGAGSPLRTDAGSQSNNALCVAAASGNTDILNLLLPAYFAELKANPNATFGFLDRSGRNALMLAAHTGHPQAVELLAPHFGLEATDQNGWTALMLAVEGMNGAEMAHECARVLLAAGANPTTRDRRGQTALHHAARGGSIGALNSLLPLVDARAADEQGYTPLMSAAGAGIADAVKALLPHSDANAMTEDGKTALALAFERHSGGDYDPSGEDLEVARVLSAASDLTRRNEKGQTPFEEATASESWPLLAALAPQSTDAEIENLLISLTEPLGDAVMARVEAFFLRQALLREASHSQGAPDAAQPTLPLRKSLRV